MRSSPRPTQSRWAALNGGNRGRRRKAKLRCRPLLREEIPPLFGDLFEPIPGRRRQADGGRNQLGEGGVRDGPLSTLEPAVALGEPPLAATVQRPQARCIWG